MCAGAGRLIPNQINNIILIMEYTQLSTSSILLIRKVLVGKSLQHVAPPRGAFYPKVRDVRKAPHDASVQNYMYYHFIKHFETLDDTKVGRQRKMCWMEANGSQTICFAQISMSICGATNGNEAYAQIQKHFSRGAYTQWDSLKMQASGWRARPPRFFIPFCLTVSQASAQVNWLQSSRRSTDLGGGGGAFSFY